MTDYGNVFISWATGDEWRVSEHDQP